MTDKCDYFYDDGVITIRYEESKNAYFRKSALYSMSIPSLLLAVELFFEKYPGAKLHVFRAWNSGVSTITRAMYIQSESFHSEWQHDFKKQGKNKPTSFSQELQYKDVVKLVRTTRQRVLSQAYYANGYPHGYTTNMFIIEDF
jgi:hypothetical protein